MTSEKVDLHALAKLYRSKEAARALFDHIAKRQRNYKETTVDRMLENLKQEGTPISRADLIDIFKELQKLNCGTFWSGRKGWSSRFEWSVEMVSVSRAAAGEPTEIAKVPENAEKEEDEGAATVEHKYQLRQDLSITIKLPKDLKAGEAERLSAYVRTLPFTE